MKNPVRITPNVSLASKSASSLREFIRREFPDGGQIPGEHDLAQMLGVNRGTVRQALNILEQEGMVIRRQGSGTYANRHVVGLKLRLETHAEFSELIEEAGYESGSVLLDVETQPMPEPIAARLERDVDSDLLCISKVFLVDDVPAIYVVDMIPEALIREPCEEGDFGQSIFEFLESSCHCRVAYGLAEITSRLAGNVMGQHLDVQAWEPLIQLDSTYYREDNEPVMFSRGCYSSRHIRFSVLRRKT